MSTVSLTLEISQDIYDKLEELAEMHNVSVPELSLMLIKDGASMVLNPEEIDAAIEAEKHRLVKAARMMPIPPED